MSRGGIGTGIQMRLDFMGHAPFALKNRGKDRGKIWKAGKVINGTEYCFGQCVT